MCENDPNRHTPRDDNRPTLKLLAGYHNGLDSDECIANDCRYTINGEAIRHYGIPTGAGAQE